MTKIEIEIIKKLDGRDVDEATLRKAIAIDDAIDLNVVSKIKLSGDYSKEYIVVTWLESINSRTVMVDGNLLLICMYYNLVVIDLNTDKIKHNIDFNLWQLFEIHKFKNGYFIYAEGENIYLNKDFEIMWRLSCGDIFVNSIVEKELEIYDDYITVFDWFGIKHFYNEQGEFDTIYYKEFDMNKN